MMASEKVVFHLLGFCSWRTYCCSLVSSCTSGYQGDRASHLAEMLKLKKVSRNPLAAHAHRELAPENPLSMDLERLELTPAPTIDPVGWTPHEHPSIVSDQWELQGMVTLPKKP